MGLIKSGIGLFNIDADIGVHLDIVDIGTDTGTAVPAYSMGPSVTEFTTVVQPDSTNTQCQNGG